MAPTNANIPAHALEDFKNVYRRIRKDIFAFCKLLNFEPTPQQHDILLAVQRGDTRIAVKSGQGTGKSRTAAIVALWRVLKDPYAVVVVTAPSMRQCQDVFMNEVRICVNQAHPIIRRLVSLTAKKVYVLSSGRAQSDDEDARPAWGINCVTATDPRNAQGYHNDHLAFIVDEASGVSRGIIEQIEGTLGQNSGDLLHFQIGNPNEKTGAFYESFTKKRAHWTCFTLNARHSPLVSPAHCDYLAEVYGEHSIAYRVRVLGEFPIKDEDAVISIEDLEACARNSKVGAVGREHTGPWQRAIGIDFARFGGDEAVTYRRSGLAVVEQKIYHGVEPAMMVAEAFEMQRRARWEDSETFYVPDATGMGQGLMYLFRQNGKRYIEFHNHGRPTNRIYADKITQAYFEFSAIVSRRKAYLPNDPILFQQLSSRLYKMNKKGRMQLESKDDYKKRMEGEESPDRGDAMVLAFYSGLEGQVRLASMDD